MMNEDNADVGEEAPWFVRPSEAEDDVKRQTSKDHALNDWCEMEAACAARLANAAAALARLDERGRAGAPLDRLATRFAVDLLRHEGVILRAEALEARALGSALEYYDERYELGLWAMKRLERAPSISKVEDLRDWLGWSIDVRTPDAALRPVIQRDADADRRIADWLSMRRDLTPLHPLTRAAALGWEWIWEGPSSPDKRLIAALIASREAAVAFGGDSVLFAPAAFRFRSHRSFTARELAEWLAAVEAGATGALLELARIEAWRGRGLKAVSGWPRVLLIDAFSRCNALSVEMAAQAIQKSNRRARELIGEFEAAGMIREITGGASFRFWTARY